ncbi:hypothetical protein Pcinc_020166 [Petrolisthes cinctipes]|uniref:Uncharacterized protein n=1 Tax=Petrolisthes cinctipes TaxID=88211 RepID=A0AAE1FIQ2_PETCI|nr:hypothetical protein Pcinc_020166 [Petrolisthes cinctipes]
MYCYHHATASTTLNDLGPLCSHCCCVVLERRSHRQLQRQGTGGITHALIGFFWTHKSLSLSQGTGREGSFTQRFLLDSQISLSRNRQGGIIHTAVSSSSLDAQISVSEGWKAREPNP